VSGVCLELLGNRLLLNKTKKPARVKHIHGLRKGNGGMASILFTGEIADVRIYNRALSAGEIQANYNATI
jgi:hypothetical protein